MNSVAVDLDRQITEQLHSLNVRQKKVLLAVAKTFAIETTGVTPYSDQFIAELDRRTMELEDGSVKGSSWEEVKSRSRDQFKARNK